MKPTLIHLLAAAQLAEMAYNADPIAHKKDAWDKAQTEYEQAAEAERLAALELASQAGILPIPQDLLNSLPTNDPAYKELDQYNQTLLKTIDALDIVADELGKENQALLTEKAALVERNTALETENSLLNSQLIEKSQKIDELEKSALSAKPSAPVNAEPSAPTTTTEAAPQALTPYQKGLQTRAANLAKAAAETDQAAKKKQLTAETTPSPTVLSDTEKEQLTLEAERLHREAALLSNTLADFEPADVAGRGPVVEQILAIREQWKDVRYKLQYGVARRIDKPAKPTAETVAGSSQALHQAEIKLELQRTRVNISKYTDKIAERPEHKLVPSWQNELARLIAVRNQYEAELRK